MTRTLTFTIGADTQTDVRTYVRRTLGFSARVMIDLKCRGKIAVNGEPAFTIHPLQAGDVLELTLFEDAPTKTEPVELPFPILYEDADFLVLDKPAGMPVHPSPGHDRDSVLNAAAYYFQDIPDFVFRPLYRLDCDTVGALVLAKNKFATAAVLEKSYTAVCEGQTPPSGRIDTPVGLLPGHKVQRCAGTGQAAATLFETLAFDGAHSLVRFTLLTGRTHQIRVHMASIGHPVAGDDLYGGRLDKSETQMLLCSTVHVTCAPLKADFTVRTAFSETQRAVFPTLFKEETPST